MNSLHWLADSMVDQLAIDRNREKTKKKEKCVKLKTY
jgi:hypothetical protein